VFADCSDEMDDSHFLFNSGIFAIFEPLNFIAAGMAMFPVVFSPSVEEFTEIFYHPAFAYSD
jgi:hypothetical protein